MNSDTSYVSLASLASLESVETRWDLLQCARDETISVLESIDSVNREPIKYDHRDELRNVSDFDVVFNVKRQHADYPEGNYKINRYFISLLSDKKFISTLKTAHERFLGKRLVYRVAQYYMEKVGGRYFWFDKDLGLTELSDHRISTLLYDKMRKHISFDKDTGEVTYLRKFYLQSPN